MGSVQAVDTNRPIVAAVTPRSGPIGGGTVIHLTGYNLAEASAVAIGGVQVRSFSVQPDGSIVATTGAAAAAGADEVTVTDADGASPNRPGDVFTYRAAAQILWPDAPTAGFQSIPVLLDASTTSGAAVSYRTTTPSVCTMVPSSGVLLLVGLGECSVTASAPLTALYYAPAPVTDKFEVSLLGGP